MYHGEVNVAQEELNSFLAVAEDLKVKGLTQNSSDTQRKAGSFTTEPQQPRLQDRPIHPGPSPQPKRPGPPPPSRTPKATPTSAYSPQEEDDIQEVVPVKSEPLPVPIETPPNHYTTMAEQTYTDNTQQHQEGILADPNMEYEEEYADYGGYEGMEGGYDNSVVGVQDGNKDLESLVLESLTNLSGGGRGTLWQCNHCGKEDKDKSMLKRHVESHFHFKHSCPYCGKEYKSRPSLQCHISTKHKE